MDCLSCFFSIFIFKKWLHLRSCLCEYFILYPCNIYFEGMCWRRDICVYFSLDNWPTAATWPCGFLFGLLSDTTAVQQITLKYVELLYTHKHRRDLKKIQNTAKCMERVSYKTFFTYRLIANAHWYRLIVFILQNHKLVLLPHRFGFNCFGAWVH